MIYLIIILAVLLIATGVFLYNRNKNVKQTVPRKVDDECCGAHAVCERDSLLTKDSKVVYYDDEELDMLAGIPASEMSDEDVEMMENVFFTLQEKDVAGWIKSLQLRNIELPESIRDEALLIISERREKNN